MYEKQDRQICETEYKKLMGYYKNISYNLITISDFRRCSAKIIDTPNYTILRSYATIIAFIEKQTGKFYDVLRYVYGYTATSCKHIAKFKSEYKNEISEYYYWR